MLRNQCNDGYTLMRPWPSWCLIPVLKCLVTEASGAATHNMSYISCVKPLLHQRGQKFLTGLLRKIAVVLPSGFHFEMKFSESGGKWKSVLGEKPSLNHCMEMLFLFSCKTCNLFTPIKEPIPALVKNTIPVLYWPAVLIENPLEKQCSVESRKIRATRPDNADSKGCHKTNLGFLNISTLQQTTLMQQFT